MSYRAGIIEAITEMKDRTGSSMIAIKKHMQSKLPSDKKWQNATFLTALKTGVSKVNNSTSLSEKYFNGLYKLLLILSTSMFHQNRASLFR